MRASCLGLLIPLRRAGERGAAAAAVAAAAASAMLSSRAQAARTAADKALQRFLRTGAAVR